MTGLVDIIKDDDLKKNIVSHSDYADAFNWEGENLMDKFIRTYESEMTGEKGIISVLLERDSYAIDIARLNGALPYDIDGTTKDELTLKENELEKQKPEYDLAVKTLNKRMSDFKFFHPNESESKTGTGPYTNVAQTNDPEVLRRLVEQISSLDMDKSVVPFGGYGLVKHLEGLKERASKKAGNLDLDKLDLDKLDLDKQSQSRGWRNILSQRSVQNLTTLVKDVVTSAGVKTALIAGAIVGTTALGTYAAVQTTDWGQEGKNYASATVSNVLDNASELGQEGKNYASATVSNVLDNASEFVGGTRDLIFGDEDSPSSTIFEHQGDSQYIGGHTPKAVPTPEAQDKENKSISVPPLTGTGTDLGSDEIRNTFEQQYAGDSVVPWLTGTGTDLGSEELRNTFGQQYTGDSVVQPEAEGGTLEPAVEAKMNLSDYITNWAESGSGRISCALMGEIIYATRPSDLDANLKITANSISYGDPVARGGGVKEFSIHDADTIAGTLKASNCDPADRNMDSVYSLENKTLEVKYLKDGKAGSIAFSGVEQQNLVGMIRSLAEQAEIFSYVEPLLREGLVISEPEGDAQMTSYENQDTR